MTERIINLVVPLAHEATDMRIAETAGSGQNASGAVTPPIGENLRQGDVDSTTRRSTRPTLTMPGIRTSTKATRTTTTRIASSAPAPSADQTERHHADFSFTELVQAYFDCRKTKRNSASALAFEQDMERNLFTLYGELQDGTYQPGRSICFVITRPKPREVWAAEFRDRIVHHLLYNRISPRFYTSFIALHILITAEGELLRVNITPKAIDGENPALATPISLLATPEELDTQMPEILTSYTSAHMDLRASLNNAVAQIEEGKPGAGKKPESKPAKKPAKTKADQAEPGAPATSEPENEPGAPMDEEPAKAETAVADQSLELPAGNAPVEQSATPAEFAPPAEQIPEQQGEIPGQEPETPAPAEKDTNTIELF